MLMYN